MAVSKITMYYHSIDVPTFHIFKSEFKHLTSYLSLIVEKAPVFLQLFECILLHIVNKVICNNIII